MQKICKKGSLKFYVCFLDMSPFCMFSAYFMYILYIFSVHCTFYEHSFFIGKVCKFCTLIDKKIEYLVLNSCFTETREIGAL